jgi:hypothetical protein
MENGQFLLEGKNPVFHLKTIAQGFVFQENLRINF